MNRREFLRAAAALGVASAALGEAQAQEQMPPLKKALILGMLPKELSLEERFRLARRLGFEGVEAYPLGEGKPREEMRAAAEAAGIRIHSIMYGGWGAPLSSADPKVVQRGQDGVRRALHTAKDLGADAVLLVPAIVNAKTRYADAYKRSQENIRPLVPLAEELKVIIAIENVWNNFLLSPIEFARYVDEFESPYVGAYFDVGNIVKYGWPEDWIRTLGKRIKKVHLKDYSRRAHKFVPLREGDVNWPEVRRALAEVGYSGFVTPEVRGGSEEVLRDLSQRVDLIIAGK